MDISFTGAILISIMYFWIFYYVERDYLEKRKFTKFNIHRIVGIQSVLIIIILIYMLDSGFFTNIYYIDLLKGLNPENEVAFLQGENYRYIPFLERFIWIFFAKVGFSSEIQLIGIMFVLEIVIVYLVYYISIEANKGRKSRDLFKKNYILYLMLPTNILLFLRNNLNFYITTTILLVSIFLYQRKKYVASFIIVGILLTFIWYVGLLSLALLINMNYRRKIAYNVKLVFALCLPVIIIAIIASIFSVTSAFYLSLYQDIPITSLTMLNLWYFISDNYSDIVIFCLVFTIILTLSTVFKGQSKEIPYLLTVMMLIQMLMNPLLDLGKLSFVIIFLIINYQGEKKISRFMINLSFVASLVDLISLLIIQKYPDLDRVNDFFDGIHFIVLMRIVNLIFFQSCNIYFLCFNIKHVIGD